MTKIRKQQITSLEAPDGYVLTADGAGNADWEEPPAGGSVDAADVTYTPTTATDWDSDADPGNADDALDQLAERVDDLENTPPGSPDADDVTYTPAVAADWDSDADPGNVDDALDQLAERVDDLENTPPGSPDAADVTYTPAVATDWDDDADPGDVDEALDQLAERVDDIEDAGGHAAVTLDADAANILDLTDQEIGLDVQDANTVFAGPTSGAADEPDFRALVETDISSLLASGWLSAGETWTYAAADDPTFTFTIADFDATAKYSAGMRIKLTQTTVKYFIITKVVFDDPGSTITVYGGTDYDLADAAISANYYSMVKAPFGFPLDPNKWMVELNDTTIRSQATPVASTWYNLGSLTLSIPIGCWKVSYQCIVNVTDATAGSWGVQTTLSTANNSESDAAFTTYQYTSDDNKTIMLKIYAEKYLTLTSKTAYYLNARTTQANVDTIYIRSDVGTTNIRAVCAYL